MTLGHLHENMYAYDELLLVSCFCLRFLYVLIMSYSKLKINISLYNTGPDVNECLKIFCSSKCDNTKTKLRYYSHHLF